MNTDYEKINKKLYYILGKNYSDQCNRVFNSKYCDIDGSFLGFVDTYFYLSKLIPKDWTVIDFGCAYAPQAFYFIHHKKYIGVDASVRKRFSFKNTEHIMASIKEYLKCPADIAETFAICNYVPSSERELVRQTYPFLYIFYP